MRFLWGAGLLMLVSSSVVAEEYYSVTTHTSKEKYILTSLTRFEDSESCQETAEARRVPMGDLWVLDSSECRRAREMSSEETDLFLGKEMPEPYLTFDDENNFPNVIRFKQVPPVVVDAMVLKWADALKAQKLKNVVVVMDPARQKIKNLFEEAKTRVTGKTSEPVEPEIAPVLPKAEAPETPAEAKTSPVKKALVKKDTLILKNGQRIAGNLIERRQHGYWFEADEGLEMLFSDAEVQELIQGA